MKRYQSLAREAGLWLALGGFQEKGPDDKHIYNTHVLLDDYGRICSSYRKIHLYVLSSSLYLVGLVVKGRALLGWFNIN
jgi:predicted amidohydrolase